VGSGSGLVARLSVVLLRVRGADMVGEGGRGREGIKGSDFLERGSQQNKNNSLISQSVKSAVVCGQPFKLGSWNLGNAQPWNGQIVRYYYFHTN